MFGIFITLSTADWVTEWIDSMDGPDGWTEAFKFICHPLI